MKQDEYKEARDLFMAIVALRAYAHNTRKTARLRAYAGPQHEGMRALLRVQATEYEELATRYAYRKLELPARMERASRTVR